MPTTPTPDHYEVFEFHGTGDPFFGGNADDRPLCVDGQFSRMYVSHQVARFATKEDAERAVAKATKRPGGKVGIHPCYSRSTK